MEFVIARQYDDYITANIDLGALQEEGINCWLRDENSVTITPYLNNAIGGIKLMVEVSQAERALGILRTLENEHKKLTPCPKCNSLNIELVSSPRKASNWLSIIFNSIFMSYIVPMSKVMHCFDCGHEYPLVQLEEENIQHNSLNK